MPAAILAGITYALIVFALGFVLGPFREFLLAPRLGVAAATAIEAVPMLCAMAWLAPRLAQGMELPPRTTAPLVMGAVALVLVLLAEMLLTQALRGIGPAGWIARYGTAEGMIGAALLLAFAAMPWLRR